MVRGHFLLPFGKVFHLMKSFGLRQLLLGVALVVAVTTCSGCTRETRTTPVNPPRYANPTPEQSFDTIFDMFRRRIEDTPVGFVVSDSTGRSSSLIGKSTVSKELIPPTGEGQPYKAIITVTTESRYAIMRTKEADDDNSADQQNEKNSSDTLGDPSADQDDLGDQSPPTKPANDTSKGRIATDVIRPPGQDKQDVRKYELEYQNGRWKLITELNTKTEQSIQNAFKNALDTQNTE